MADDKKPHRPRFYPGPFAPKIDGATLALAMIRAGERLVQQTEAHMLNERLAQHEAWMQPRLDADYREDLYQARIMRDKLDFGY